MNRLYERDSVFLAALLMVAVIVFAGTIDDEVNPEVFAMLNTVENAGESDAYLYLLGIHAPDGTDPAELGRELFDLADHMPAEEIIELHEDADRLPKPTDSLFCNSLKEGCLNSLFTTDFDIKKIRLEHNTLIARAEHFYRLGEFRTLTRPAADELIPEIGYLSAAERIKVLEAISLYKEGQSKLAINSLMKQLNELRQAMALQDNLLGKLLFIAKLSEALDVASIILARQKPKSVDRIPQLTADEKNLQVVAAREFILVYDLLQGLTSSPKDSFGHKTVRWLIRTVYKPNMSANAVLPQHQRMAHLTQLSSENFARAVESDNVTAPRTPIIRNALGNYLINKAPPSAYDKYAIRFHDLDVKIAIFNHLYHEKREFTTAKNPYYPNDPLELLADRLCFRGPGEDNRIKCLRTTVDFVITRAIR